MSDLTPGLFCNDTVRPLVQSFYPQFDRVINVSVNIWFLEDLCNDLENSEEDSKTEDKYSSPMILIGIYISVASAFCILAMVLDLFYGFRNKKFWFPCKYFSLNAAFITVIAVAMKLPVDLSSPMPDNVDQVAKVGSLAFMCTMMSNFMPSLASMDNKSLLANVIGLSILVITVIANIFIQVRTQVISAYTFDINLIYIVPSSPMVTACIYMGMLLFLLMILISSAIAIPTSKRILEIKYQATSKPTLNDQHLQENLICTVDKLRQLVKRYWIMTETGSPQFVMVSNALSYASGILCAISMCIYLRLVYQANPWDILRGHSNPVYKWSMNYIFITQSIGIVVGSVVPIFRCFTLLSFKSFSNQNMRHFKVFKVEKYWTQKLCEWKESCISFLSSGRRSRALIYNLITSILSCCIGFQKVIVVSCKIIGLIPIASIIFVIYCSYCFKSLKAKMFTPPTPASSSGDTNEDLSNYVLLVEDNSELAEKTIKGISDSMNHLIHKVEKKKHTNLLKLLEKSVTFDGVGKFDTDQVQSLPSVELVNSWSLPIITLTCIAMALPNIHKDRVGNLLNSVGEGLLYTHLVEESLNREFVYVNIRRATLTLWHEVEHKCKWLGNTLERIAYEGKTPKEVIKLLAHMAEEIVNETNTSTNGDPVEKENIPLKLIAANSMHRIALTILHTYESHNLEIIEDELFTQLSEMIADTLAACLINIPQAVIMRCNESVIEKREASVLAAINLFGQTTEIIKGLETRELPNMDPDKMGFIDEWRLHMKQP